MAIRIIKTQTLSTTKVCSNVVAMVGGDSIDMSEKEFKSYSFNDETDPTDEQLAKLMRQAAQDARESNEVANKRFFEILHERCQDAKNRSLSKSK